MERAERSLQAPLQKCRKASPPKKCREASTTKKCHKATPPKKCCKEDRLKICSKCSPPQKCCETALQKVPCYVEVAPAKNVKAAPHLTNAAKQPPSKNTTKHPPQNASPQPPLRFRSRPPLTLKPSLSVGPCLCLETVKQPRKKHKTFGSSLHFLRDGEIVAIDIRKAVHHLSNTEILL